MAAMKYLAMRQVYEYLKDDEGKVICFDVPNPYEHYAGAPKTIKRPKSVLVKGKFSAFGANGKVVSLYDSPGKAARYCGKDGYVAELDPADCRKYTATVEEQFAHCEARMLFWGIEADRLKKEMLLINA